MAHKHSVYDTSLHFIIDGNTRLVKNSTEAKVTLVQYDHNSERITFELPRYIDGHDMSLCTDAQVHYINIERKTNRESVGIYECDDLQIAPDDENVVICSWLISKNATRFVGSLFFVIRFICSEDREITYSWNTARHTGLSVTDGIYNGEDVDEIVESDAFKIFNETINAANTATENANEAAQKANEAAHKANDSIIHIRYSKYADGTDFVGVWTPMYDYIGIASGLTAPTDPSDYQWSRFNAKGYWTGSTKEYNAIPDDEIIDDYLYLPYDDTFLEDLESGEFVVGKARNATNAMNATNATKATNATHADKASAWVSRVVAKDSGLFNTGYFENEMKTLNLNENLNGKYIALEVSISTPSILEGTILGVKETVQITRTRPVKCYNNSEHGKVYFTEPCWGTNIHFRAQGSDFLYWCDNPTPISGYRIFIKKILVLEFIDQ